MSFTSMHMTYLQLLQEIPYDCGIINPIKMPGTFSNTIKSTGEPKNFSQFRNMFTNVTIICQKGTKTTKAHAIILTEASPFIEPLLSFQTGELKRISPSRRDTFHRSPSSSSCSQMRRLKLLPLSSIVSETTPLTAATKQLYEKLFTLVTKFSQLTLSEV